MHPAVVLALVVASACKEGHDPCDDLEKEVAECYDDICDGSGAGGAACACWDQGKVLDNADCSCRTLDLSAECAMFEEPEDAIEFFDCNRAKKICTAQ